MKKKKGIREMSEEMMLIDVPRRAPEMTLVGSRERLEKLLRDLRARLNEAVEDEDMDAGTADEVMKTMEDDGDFSHAWYVTMDDWKEDAWDFPSRAEFCCGLKDLLSEVECAFYTLRRVERAEMGKRNAGSDAPGAVEKP